MPDGPEADSHVITDRTALRLVYKAPTDAAVKKVLPALDKHAVNFIALSPFCVLATSNEAGHLDASPKGGPAGFVKVRDANTVMIPDWPGNNRLDGLENIVSNAHVGVLFFVPGMNEMLRINGRGKITTDPALKPLFETKGKLPISVIVVETDQVFLHCARALDRSGLWDASRHIDRTSFPTLGQILQDQVAGYDGAAVDALIEKHKNDLY
jgi:PPOX class probable FMN-dependent enzyme